MSDDLHGTITRAIRDVARDVHANLKTCLTAPGTSITTSPEEVASLITSERAWERRAPRHLANVGRFVPSLAAPIVAHRDASLGTATRLLALAWQPALTEDWFPAAVLAAWSRAHGIIDAALLETTLAADHVELEGLLELVLELGPQVSAASLLQALEPRTAELERIDRTPSWGLHRRRAHLVRALSTAPLSATLADALVPYALHAPREITITLRRALRGVPVDRITAFLTSATRDDRERAADWLAERRDADAVPALLAAMKKERSDGVRAAIVGALEACGAPAAIDRAALQKEAQKLLAKGWPDALAFVDRETLPALRWRDGTEVPRAIVEGWIVSAHKAKAPEPSPLVRALAARMEPAGPRALARVILDRFIAWDTRVPTDLSDQEEGILAHALAGWGKGKAREELLSRPDAKNFGLAVRSAVADKGVLGVVAALGDGSLAPTLESYVRTHRGFRASQSRAMLAVLSWIDDPRATQTLLRFASRFRTPGIQKEARLLAEALAARRGWTMAELADRTVPTAGLDDDGTMTLVYGRAAAPGAEEEVVETRRFVARLDESDTLALFDAEGAPVKALPDARRDEDEVVVEDAKKRLSSARKELKALFAAQRERLHEAMLGERRWPLADFRTYLLEHPVLGRLARRALFTAYEGERLVATFRPAGDGSFVAVDHETVVLDPGTSIGLLHSSLIPRELDRAWSQHLADYELLPLFAQLDRAAAPDDHVEGRRIRPPAGAPVLAVQVRSRAKRAGYAERRGDGGFIEAMTKSLPTLGRTLVVELEGIEPIADPKVTAPVLGIAIHDSSDPEGPGTELTWSDVSVVMRDEAWNDLVAIVG